MRIALLGCKGTTWDLLNSIVSQRSFSLDYVITLPRRLADANSVAFYKGEEITSYCRKHDIPTYVVRSYHLKRAEDLQFFKKAGIDLLLVMGWERLIPAEVLGTLGKFACGMHGSPYGLPKGRGRSPLNWSIITGHKRFVTCLFRYDEAMDAGNIIGFKVFEINVFDTIASLHAKNRIAMHQLLQTYMPLIQSGEVASWPQPPEKPTYYPKRSPDDGGIDWSQSTNEIYNLVRAVAPPYPAAYCYHNETKMLILEAHPFDSALFDSGVSPGTVVDVSVALEQFAVKTVDGALLVKKFSPLRIDDLHVGHCLRGVDHNDILQQIISRYPPHLAEDEKEV